MPSVENKMRSGPEAPGTTWSDLEQSEKQKIHGKILRF